MNFTLKYTTHTVYTTIICNMYDTRLHDITVCNISNYNIYVYVSYNDK